MEGTKDDLKKELHVHNVPPGVAMLFTNGNRSIDDLVLTQLCGYLDLCKSPALFRTEPSPSPFISERKFSLKIFWTHTSIQQELGPVVCGIALRALCVPVGTAQVESAFSRLRDISTPKRSNLSPKSVMDELLLSYNLSGSRHGFPCLFANVEGSLFSLDPEDPPQS
jgi:hypothetical protein